MRVSTRTPEGQPLECRICGRRTFVLFSDPPGDSVCPSCGCFAWIVQPIDEPIRDIRVQAKIISNVVNNIGRCDTTISIAAALNNGLRDILSPDAVVIWSTQGHYANELRLTRLSKRGDEGDETFVQAIVKTRQSMVRRDLNSESYRFKFGAPLLKRSSHRMIGAIEISYLSDVTEQAEQTITRVVESLAAVSVGKGPE